MHVQALVAEGKAQRSAQPWRKTEREREREREGVADVANEARILTQDLASRTQGPGSRTFCKA